VAFPFGSPTFGDYLAWARSVGCDCKIGDIGGVVGWRITAPSGLHVMVMDTQQNERLVSSVLNHLDRRLGLDSPFDRVREA
jgi:hypothetical protein